MLDGLRVKVISTPVCVLQRMKFEKSSPPSGNTGSSLSVLTTRSPGARFTIAFDSGNDGRISGITIEGIGNITTLYQPVAIWSLGANTSSSNEKDNVYSFPVEWDKTNNNYKLGK